MAEHLACQWSLPVDGTQEGLKGVGSEDIVGATRPTDVMAAKATVFRHSNWARALLAAKASMVRLSDPDHDEEGGARTVPLHRGEQRRLQHAGGAA